jgi:hypothetical protein
MARRQREGGLRMLKVNGAVISNKAFVKKYGMVMGTYYGWAVKFNRTKSSEIRLEKNGTIRLAGIRDCDKERERDGDEDDEGLLVFYCIDSSLVKILSEMIASGDLIYK